MRNLKYVDIHVHADPHHVKNHGVIQRHGEYPDKIAAGVIENDLDGYVVVSHQEPTEEFFKVEEEVAKLTQNTSRKVWGILGMEYVFNINQQKFHLGYLYKLKYSPSTLPCGFDKDSGLKGLEEYKQAYPGLVVLYHPGIVLKKKAEYCEDTILDLCDSGLVDGIEILNGSTICRCGKMDREIALAALNKGNLAICGGSDAHKRNYIGMCVTGFGEVGNKQFKAVQQTQSGTVGTESRAKDFFKAIEKRKTVAIARHPERVRRFTADTIKQIDPALRPLIRATKKHGH